MQHSRVPFTPISVEYVDDRVDEDETLYQVLTEPISSPSISMPSFVQPQFKYVEPLCKMVKKYDGSMLKLDEVLFELKKLKDKVLSLKIPQVVGSSEIHTPRKGC